MADPVAATRLLAVRVVGHPNGPSPWSSLGRDRARIGAPRTWRW
jgi:hypothetical protein